MSRHVELDRCSPRGPCPLPRSITFTAGNSCYSPALPCCKRPHPASRYSFLSSESQLRGPLPRSDSLAVPPRCALCCPSNPFSHPNWGGVPAAWAGLPCWGESPPSYELFLPEVSFAWLGWLGLGWLGLDSWKSCGRPCQTQEVLQQDLKA